MTIDLYYHPASTPCRSVRMVAQGLGVELNLKLVDVLAGDHLKPEFSKISPQGGLTSLHDNGFILCEADAIIQYLVEKYGKDDSLFPRDVQKRAVISQRLYFNTGTLYKTALDSYRPFLHGGKIDEEKYKDHGKALGFLNTFLEGHTYVAGETLTIADIVIFASVSTSRAMAFDMESYPNVVRWYAHCEPIIPGKEINDEGIELMKQHAAQIQATHAAAAAAPSE